MDPREIVQDGGEIGMSRVLGALQNVEGAAK
jgi:hypothetical protein